MAGIQVNSREAFGLPPNTVRATAFLALTGTACYLAAKGLQIQPEFLAVWTGVVGFYFGQKMGKPPEPPQPPAAGGTA